MKFKVSEVAGITVIELNLRRATTDVTDEFLEIAGNLIAKENRMKIVLDFNQVEFTDSSFLATLIVIHKRIAEKKGEIKLACFSNENELLLKRIMLDKVFSVYPTVNRAVYHFMVNNKITNNKIIVTLPGEMKYIHFISDSARALIQYHYDHPNPEEMERIVHEVQVLIYELFSNCVKHSRSTMVKFLFDLHPFHFYIKTITNGNGFYIKPVDRTTLTTKGDVLIPTPFPEDIIGQDFIVYQDNVNEVLCHVESKHSISLSRRSNPEKDQGEFEVPEHYGLLLIAELSSEASWQRNDNEDVFVIRKDIM